MSAANPFHPYNPPKLTIELVPDQQWEDNLRSRLSRSDWTKLRKACYARVGHRCEICNGKGRKHPVECHEIWHFDDENLIQRLDGLISLCPSCHRVKHMGLAFHMGKGEQAVKHLAKVNGWPLNLAETYTEGMFELWQLRRGRKYTLDLSWLDNASDYVENAAGAQRKALSDRAQQAAKIIADQRSAEKERSIPALSERSVPKSYGAWS